MALVEILSPKVVERWLVEFVNRMLQQLTANYNPLQESDLQRMLDLESSDLYIILVDGVPVGMLTLCHYYAPTGCKVWIEDVVVDSSMRGKGFGRRLIEYALAEARRFSPCSVLLTSRPARKEANLLYQSSGFEQRETNVYRCKIKENK